MKIFSLCIGILSLSMASCGHPSLGSDPQHITSINIIDHNGMSESINAKERLMAFEQTNFLSPQPYQKVLRVYGRQKNGDVAACITSYHPNGQIKQYLEVINNRANGMYREWHPSGQLKVEACVIGGIADVNTKAEQSWLFEGVSRAWNAEGALEAEIGYAKGVLQGSAIYYHPNRKTWKVIPYVKGEVEGSAKVFLDTGELLQTTEYKEGKKDGLATRYWSLQQVAAIELYEKGFLKEGTYYSQQGKPISSIHDGEGMRPLFDKEGICALHQYQHGVQEGLVEIYREGTYVSSRYSIKSGEKQGEEITYFPHSQQPKLLITWNQGVMQGVVKTWYETGSLESQREMSDNVKQGLLTAWYPDSTLMLVEEYDNDRLQKGEYYKMGETNLVSQVEKGKGFATLFQPDGTFSRKVEYRGGRPID
jgi:antitoxin component YwqK of YwqJK toxin-antitoxin module